MSLDPELELWQKDWKAGADTVPVELASVQAAAIQQEAKMRRGLAVELGVGFLFLPFSFAFAWIDRRAEMILWAVVVWILTIAVSAFTIWNWQTLWKDSVHSVHDFTLLRQKRLNASLRSVVIGYWFVAVNVFIAGGWYAIDLGLHRIGIRRFLLGIVLIVAISACFVCVLSRRKAKALRELEQIGPISE